MESWRTRIGLLLPSVNTVLEPEFYMVAPKGVSIHTARMKITSGTPEGLIEMEKRAKSAADLLATARVDVLVYGCTSGSFVKGLGGDREIIKGIEDETGIPTTTTSTAMIDAFKVLRMRKISVATPYMKEVDRRLKEFIEAHGFTVTKIKGLSIEDPFEIGKQPLKVSYELAKKVDVPEADGVFISCTNFKTLGAIKALEDELKKPVTSANQVTIWKALRMAGVQEPLSGYGKLLEEFMR
jgi:maleate isomerase